MLSLKLGQRLSAFGILILCLECVKSRNVPPIPCPDIFNYMRFGDNNVGIVLIHNPQAPSINNITEINVELVQREPITSSFEGRLSVNQELLTAFTNLATGKPISYRIDFPNPQNLPKVTLIRFNGRDICRGEEYNPPRTTIIITHVFFPTRNVSLQNLLPRDFYEHQQVSSHEIPAWTLSNAGALNTFDFNRDRTRNTDFTPLYDAIIPRPTHPVNEEHQPLPDVSCGLEVLTPFVAGGNEFPRGKFPWLVAVYTRDSADLKFKCGGSLISSRTVITAAHCFPTTTFPSDRISVNLGRHNLFVSEEDSQQRDISSVTFHPNYNISAISDADIALLHMSIPVRFNQYIRPICLWAQSSDLSLIVNNNAYVAGWGSDNKGNSVSSIAKMVEAKIVSESECLRSSEIFRFLTSARSICAGNRDGTGPCIGDSGGGLMMNVNGVWTLRGVVSVGKTIFTNCDLNEFVVYCDVAKHMTWINENMRR